MIVTRSYTTHNPEVRIERKTMRGRKGGYTVHQVLRGRSRLYECTELEAARHWVMQNV